MDFRSAYPWFAQGVEELSFRRSWVVPVRYAKDADETPVSSQRSTLRMRWRMTVDSKGRLCMQARWDARRQIRPVR